MIDERIERAVLHFEEACHQSDHHLCDQSRLCRDALTAVGEVRGREERAARFDVGREVLERSTDMPDRTWPTATLLGVVHRLLPEQPSSGGVWRGAAITTALARLAERGLPADSVVRTCVGPHLVRRIIITTSALWLAVRNGDVPRSRLEEVEGWLELFDAEFQDLHSSADVAYVSTLAITGSIRSAADDWLADASITHILGWRRDDYLHVEPIPGTLELHCGTSGTRWVYERSVMTYPAQWHPDSRIWESAYLADPEDVAELTGLHPAILAERTVTGSSLAKANFDVVSGRADVIFADVTRGELMETVISMMGSGLLTAARHLVGRARRERPQETALALMDAFCTIPLDPTAAETTLRAIEGALKGDVDMRTAAILDRAAVALMQGKQAKALAIASTLDDDARSVRVWLWEPHSLPDSPAIMYGTAQEWVTRLTAPVASEPS